MSTGAKCLVTHLYGVNGKKTNIIGKMIIIVFSVNYRHKQGNQRWQTSPAAPPGVVGIIFPYILTPIPNLYDHLFPRYGQITFLTFRRPTTLTFDLKF